MEKNLVPFFIGPIWLLLYETIPSMEVIILTLCLIRLLPWRSLFKNRHSLLSYELFASMEQFLCKSIFCHQSIKVKVKNSSLPWRRIWFHSLLQVSSFDHMKLYLPWKLLFLPTVFTLYVSVNYFHGGH